MKTTKELREQLNDGTKWWEPDSVIYAYRLLGYKTLRSVPDDKIKELYAIACDYDTDAWAYANRQGHGIECHCLACMI